MRANNNDTHSVFVTVGSTNHSSELREPDDYYATDPIALEKLLELESFSNDVWECACGSGHLSRVLSEHGYHVRSTDIADRGFGEPYINFLSTSEKYEGDIITNPPYKYASEFVRHAIDTVTDGHRVAMFMRLQFLEGKSRRKLFEQYPPKLIYVSSSRINCCKNGDFGIESRRQTGAIAHAWIIWEKGYVGPTELRWFN